MKPSTIELAKAYLQASNAGNDAERQAIAKQILDMRQADTNAEFFGAIAKAANCKTDAEVDECFSRVDLRRVVIEDPQPQLGPFQGASWKPDDPIPDRDWLIENFLPAGRLASLYGEGAIGKSMLAMQIAAAIMHGGRPIALDPELSPETESDALADTGRAAPSWLESKGKVLWCTWEDEINEFRRRWRMAFNAGALIEPNADPEKLTLVNMRHPDIGGPLWAPDSSKGGGHISSRATWTDAGKRFLDSLEGHVLAVVDPLAAAFGSNENDRALVRQFTAAVDGYAETTSCAVLLIGHPPKSQDSGGFSGSTDWRNSVRASYQLETSTVKIEDCENAKAYRLVNDKANYAATGKSIWLRRHYRKGTGGELGNMAWFATTAGKAAIDPAAQKVGGNIKSNPYDKE